MDCKRLIILGSAECTKTDYDVLSVRFPEIEFDIMFIGVSALWDFTPEPKYVATYHAKDIPMIRNNCRGVPQIIHHKKHPAVSIVEPISGPSGSSALLGTTAALKLGYTHIVLCGCPLLGVNGHKRSYNKQFAGGWNYRYHDVKNNVRSMSGWTKQLLGEPTYAWISAEHNAAPAV